jgi:NADH-quinone oxidoreductase subunit L
LDYTYLYQSIPLTHSTLLALVVLFIPLLNFIWLSLIRNKSGEISAWVASGFLLGSVLAAALVFQAVWWGNPAHSRMIWFEIPTSSFAYPFTVGVQVNRMAALMLLAVTLVSWIVHVFSIRYMEHDEGYSRYFALLGLFTFAMLGIVIMDNLLMIFFFWELVGVSSYALIGFWHRRPAAIKASTKAFLMNRVGDVGFIIGMLVLWSQFGTLDLWVLEDLMQQSVFTDEGTWLSYFRVNNLLVENAAPTVWLTVAGLGLVLGAIGKSAQLPLFSWLPNAMEGPTPVSALLHAATMVAAGVYLLLRVFMLLDATTLTTVAVIGSITAFVAAISALVQYDIKRVLAYSTISQLGYMMAGIGVGAYQASFFHLITHASFKAGLFLAAGAIIHRMHHLEGSQPLSSAFDPQDMRWMGGLRTRMPITFVAYVVTAAALVGIPLFSGFLSKDAILSGTLVWASLPASTPLDWHWVVPGLMFVTVLLTALYMGRQLLLVFFGDLRAQEPTSSSPLWQPSWATISWLMRVPLIVLALLSLGVVYSLNPLSVDSSWLLASIPYAPQAVPGPTFDYTVLAAANPEWHLITTVGTLGMIIVGLAIAFGLYRPGRMKDRPLELPLSQPKGVAAFFAQNWFLDRLYQRVIIYPVLLLSKFLHWLDTRLIDGVLHFLAFGGVIAGHIIAWIDRTLVDGLVRSSAGLIQFSGSLVRSVQTGRIQTYLIISLLALVGLLYWLVQF